MYSRAHYPGDSIDQYALFGVLEDSTEVRILPEDLGLNFFQFRRGPVAAIHSGRTEELELFMQLYDGTQGNQLIGLRLEHQLVILSEQGFETLPPRTVRFVPRDMWDMGK